MNAHWPASSIHRSSSRYRQSCTSADPGKSRQRHAKVSQWSKHRSTSSSWNLDTLNHGKLERFLTYFDADITGQIVQRYDPPRSMAGRFGGIRVKKLASTRRPHCFGRVCTTRKRTPAAQGALLGSSHTDNGKASKTHIHHLWKRLQWGPLPDGAAIGWHHQCEALTDNGAHISEICGAAQLWTPATWSSRWVPSNPCWEANTWQGHNGEQSKPDHILLSVDLATPPVTVDFLSSRNLRGTALAPIDHAPLRITLRYRSRAAGRRGRKKRFDRAKLAAAATDLHFAKQFIDEMQNWMQANQSKLEQLAQETHPDPSWQYMESSILELAMTAFQASDLPKRNP